LTKSYQTRLKSAHSILQQMYLPEVFFEVYLAKNGNNEMQISETLPCWI